MFLIGTNLGYYVDPAVTTLSKRVPPRLYNVSIIARAGGGRFPFRACMIYDALHYHQSKRPINAHREPLRTLSFDRGKIKYPGRGHGKRNGNGIFASSSAGAPGERYFWTRNRATSLQGSSSSFWSFHTTWSNTKERRGG